MLICTITFQASFWHIAITRSLLELRADFQLSINLDGRLHIVSPSAFPQYPLHAIKEMRGLKNKATGISMECVT